MEFCLVTEFICPYVNLPIERPCTVESCSFNLANVAISRAYLRCFLNYVKATGHNPYKRDELEQVEFGSQPLSYREHIARILLDLKPEDETEAKRTFYISLFSIMAHDTTVSLAKKQHSPVPYMQCCVCGSTTEELWFPKGNVLPSGYGYCSWACWQESPPPLLALTKTLEVDFSDLTQNIPFPHGQKSRLVFTLHLTRWILGEASLT
jgi:hypothetical protein